MSYEIQFKKQQQKELEKIEICIDILKNARNELYLSMRFFDVILSGFEFLPDTKISGMGTDGFTDLIFIQTI